MDSFEKSGLGGGSGGLVYASSNISTARPARYCPSGVISFLMDSDGERLKEGRQAAAFAPSRQRDRPYCWSSRLGFYTPVERSRGVTPNQEEQAPRPLL
jgi:hypothetical protein